MTNTVIYTRVSTEEQAKTNMSLENQEKACREFADRIGHKVLEVFREEGASAKTADRKELLRMLNYCRDNKGNVDNLIVWKVDRFARKAEDHLTLRAMLMKFGVKLLSVTEPIEDTNTGRLMETLLAAFAQFDNEVRAERSTTGRNARIAQGGWPNYAPLGYINTKDSLNRPTLVGDPNRAKLVSKVFNQFRKATYTQKQIAEYAFKVGLKSRMGGKLSTQTVVNLLHNVAYIARITTPSGEQIRALHKPLISDEVFYDVQAVLSGKGKEFRTSKDKDWPLRAGFVRCADCNTPLTGSAPKGRSRHYPKYSCPKCKTSITGKPVSIDRDTLHNDFQKLLVNIRPHNKNLQLFKRVVLVRWNEEYKDLNQLKSSMNQDLDALDEKRQRVMDLFIEGKLSNIDKDLQLNKIDSERAVLRIRHSELEQDVDNRELVIDVAIDFMDNVSNYWHNAQLELQRRFQNLVFPEGMTYEFGKGFGIAKLGESYEVIKQITSKKPSMVGMVGFEPTANRL